MPKKLSRIFSSSPASPKTESLVYSEDTWSRKMPKSSESIGRPRNSSPQPVSFVTDENPYDPRGSQIQATAGSFHVNGMEEPRERMEVPRTNTGETNIPSMKHTTAYSFVPVPPGTKVYVAGDSFNNLDTFMRNVSYGAINVQNNGDRFYLPDLPPVPGSSSLRLQTSTRLLSALYKETLNKDYDMSPEQVTEYLQRQEDDVFNNMPESFSPRVRKRDRWLKKLSRAWDRLKNGPQPKPVVLIERISESDLPSITDSELFKRARSASVHTEPINESSFSLHSFLEDKEGLGGLYQADTIDTYPFNDDSTTSLMFAGNENGSTCRTFNRNTPSSSKRSSGVSLSIEQLLDEWACATSMLAKESSPLLHGLQRSGPDSNSDDRGSIAAINPAITDNKATKPPASRASVLSAPYSRPPSWPLRFSCESPRFNCNPMEKPNFPSFHPWDNPKPSTNFSYTVANDHVQGHSIREEKEQSQQLNVNEPDHDKINVDNQQNLSGADQDAINGSNPKIIDEIITHAPDQTLIIDESIQGTTIDGDQAEMNAGFINIIRSKTKRLMKRKSKRTA